MRTIEQSFLCRNIIRKDEAEVLIDREMLAEVLDFAKKDRPKHIMHRDGWTLRRPPPSPEQYIKVNFGKLTILHAAYSLSVSFFLWANCHNAVIPSSLTALLTSLCPARALAQLCTQRVTLFGTLHPEFSRAPAELK